MSAEQRELARDKGDWVSITVETPTYFAPGQEWVARTLAGLLAWQYDVPVLDLTTGHRLDGDEMLASLHAKENGCIRMADWVSVVSSRTDGPELRTRGMRRYGLPELAVTEHSWRYETEWCALLTAIAFRVREKYGEALNGVHNQAVIAGQVPSETMPGQLDIPDEIGLNSDDVADAYCLPGSFWSRRCGSRWLGSSEWLSETPVRLAIDALSTTLVVHPPLEWAQPDDFLDFKAAARQSMPTWPALAEAEPFVTRTQLINEFVLCSAADVLADPDLIPPKRPRKRASSSRGREKPAAA